VTSKKLLHLEAEPFTADRRINQS